MSKVLLLALLVSKHLRCRFHIQAWPCSPCVARTNLAQTPARRQTRRWLLLVAAVILPVQGKRRKNDSRIIGGLAVDRKHLQHPQGGSGPVPEHNSVQQSAHQADLLQSADVQRELRPEVSGVLEQSGGGADGFLRR
jgi:hypothetical protein